MANDRYIDTTSMDDRRSGNNTKVNIGPGILDKTIKNAEKSIQEATEQGKKGRAATSLVVKNAAEGVKDAVGNLGKALSDYSDQLTKTMKEFVSTQEAMAYNLDYSGRALSDITKTLNDTLGYSSIVKQQKVYENLTTLVRQGIVNNVEQRAYLQTLSQDLGMVFNATNGTLTRLIRLQQSDLSSHRMAIEASLKEFLNQNFKTSEYIHQGFEKVSENLLEAQSLMSASGSMALESTIQKWMGALSSVGFSGTDSLSQALGYLGSGNLSALSGSPLQNLLIMGAARSGLSYGDLLNNGLTSTSANQLMSGIVSYLGGMSGSNVVKSEYARIFGLGVSDISAASNITDAMLEGIEGSVIGTDIAELLNKTDTYIYTTQRIANLIDNFSYKLATGIASDNSKFLTYMTTDFVSHIVADAFEGVSLFGVDIGDMIDALPLFYALGSDAGGISGFGKKALSALSGDWKSAFPLIGAFYDILAGNNGNSAYNIYQLLGAGGGNFFNNTASSFVGRYINFSGSYGLDVSG